MEVTEGTHRHRHHHLVQVRPLVDPTPVLSERVQLVVGDQVGLEVLLPVADTLHPVVRLGVDVDGSAEVVHGPAVGLVDGDLLLVGVADRQPGDVLLAGELASPAAVDVVPGVLGDSLDDSRLEQVVALLHELEGPRHWTSHRDRILLCKSSK